jgi:hypothetical protein
MSCRVQVRGSFEQPERPVIARRAPTGPLEPAVERPRRIDAYIDYFGSDDTRRTRIASDPGGEALMDGDTY